jgi:DNA-binding response OmpR family regulator
MVVDDDDNVRRMMCVMLEAEGYATVGARDGLDALERMRDVSPSLVFVDLMMPRMDGEHLIHSMRADAELSGIPVAIMSGQTHAPTTLSGETRLVKPVELDEMLSVADRYSRNLARGE